MKSVILLLSTLFFLPMIASAQGSTSELQAALRHTITQDIIREVYDIKTNPFTIKRYGGPADLGGFRIEFEHRSSHYIVEHNWWRPGIKIQVLLANSSVFTPVLIIDYRSDGFVNMARYGDSKIFDDSSSEGILTELEHRAYWQYHYGYVLMLLKSQLYN